MDKNMDFNKVLYSNTNSTKLILKVPGNKCNLNCTYCFEKTKEIKKHPIIDPDYLGSLLKSIKSKVSILLHGGEPLLTSIIQMDNLLKVVRASYGDKIESIKLQTNGTLLTEQWINLFFEKYSDLNIEISISLDGIDDLNDQRIDNNGKQTYSQVKNAFDLLSKRNIKAGVLSVINKNTLTQIDKYMNLFKEISNIKFVKLIPLFNVENNVLTKTSITPIEYADFVLEIGNIYIRDEIYKTIPIEPLLSIFQKINKKKSRFCNFNNTKCFNFISVYPENLIGGCDSLPISDYNIPVDNKISFEDNIEVFLSSEKTTKLKKLLSQCNDCDIYEFCTGGCLAQRLYFINNKDLSNQYCEYRHMLYKYSKSFVK